MLAHGLHDAIVLLGLWGLAALLLPHVLERRSLGQRSAAMSRGAHQDEHARRVAELRSALASGVLADQPSNQPPSQPPVPSPSRDPTAERPEDRTEARPGEHGRDTPSSTSVLGLPLTLVAGTAAASIHAAVAPAHFEETPLFGLFFLAVAALQLWWVTSLGSSPRDALLRLGIVLNSALIGLWLVTRLVGLPFGLLVEPHPVGGWDVACVLWQLAVIASCIRLLQHGLPTRMPGWFDWHPTTRGAVGAAVFTMTLLTAVGAHS